MAMRGTARTSVSLMLDPEQAIDRIHAVFDPPPGYRTLHAKGRFYSGTFTATPEATALCRAGHLQGDPVPVLVRWSNGSPNAKTGDHKPDVRGLSVSFRLPDGGATDLLGQTSTAVPGPNARGLHRAAGGGPEAGEAAAVSRQPPAHRGRPHREREGQVAGPALQLRGGDVLPDPCLPLARRRRGRRLGSLHVRAARHPRRPSRGRLRRQGAAPGRDGGPAGQWPGPLRAAGPGCRPTGRPPRPDVGLDRARASCSPGTST